MNINNNLNENFIEAAFYGNYNVAKELLNRGAKINATGKAGRQAIHVVAEEGNVPFLKFLINRGAKVNARDILGRTPIHYASLGRNNEGVSLNKIRLLLNRGANIQAQDNNGLRPVHYAAMRGKLPIVKELIVAGAGVKNFMTRRILMTPPVADYIMSVIATRRFKRHRNSTYTTVRRHNNNNEPPPKRLRIG